MKSGDMRGYRMVIRTLRQPGANEPVDVQRLTSSSAPFFTLTHVSYPNFVRGLLFDDMQPLIGRFKVLGTLCCTICKSRDAPEVKRKQAYAIRENSVM